MAYLMGGVRVPALVLADRGAIAPGGRHVYHIAIKPDDPDERDEFETVEESLVQLSQR